jgi:mono/diheme cytochrome c family protein
LRSQNVNPFVFDMFPKSLSRLMMLLPLFAALAATAQTAADADAVAAGRRIYLEGVLPDGQPLHGVRLDTGAVKGAAAACVNCHRPSGLGMVEGTVGVPPITGRALFGGGEPVIVRMDRWCDQALSLPHLPYDQAVLAAAVRDGQLPSGKTMHALMPRYTLTDAQLLAVSAYLKTLSNAWSPGVSADSIHIATVITPGVTPERRTAFLSTMTTLLNQININVKSSHRQKMVSAIERRLGSRRKLALDVWDLSGPPATWSEQLARRQQENPVFAILSGLGQDEWKPVQDFCESSRVACWFPSVDLVPAGAAQSQFSLYFSAGIALEAEVIANKLGSTRGRIVQVVAADPVARRGAEVLRSALAAGSKAAPNPVVKDVDASQGVAAVKAALAGLGKQDSLVLWLRPADLKALANLNATAPTVLVSATLAGGELPELPTALRKQASLVQPLEVERLRNFNLERFNHWRDAMKIPAVDMRMQSEVYFATRSLVATVHGMLNNLHTEYLIERAEAGLSMFEAMQVQDEIKDMMMGPMNKRPLPLTPPTAAEQAAMADAAKAQSEHLDELRKRGGTTVYPRLSLAQGQRFASKGAYLAKLNPQGSGTIGEPEWVVP